jgi:hypothetical protein
VCHYIVASMLCRTQTNPIDKRHPYPRRVCLLESASIFNHTGPSLGVYIYIYFFFFSVYFFFGGKSSLPETMPEVNEIMPEI